MRIRDSHVVDAIFAQALALGLPAIGANLGAGEDS
jgi:hypothetical protein